MEVLTLSIIILDNLILGSITLIISGKSLLPCNTPYSEVSDIRYTMFGETFFCLPHDCVYVHLFFSQCLVEIPGKIVSI